MNFLNLENPIERDAHARAWLMEKLQFSVIYESQSNLKGMLDILFDLSSNQVFLEPSTIEEIILDCLWVLELQWEDDRFSVEYESLANLTRILRENEFISEELMIERLPSRLLEKAKLIESASDLERKVIRRRTMQFYKQQKFNLLREESEGYSKVVTEIFEQVTSLSSSTNSNSNNSVKIGENVQKTCNNLLQLIGYFDLDPNRVVDIILDQFMEYVMKQHIFFLDLLNCFKIEPEKLASIVGFKFQNYASNEGVPRSLCLIAALLIRRNYIFLGHLYPHLEWAEETENCYQDFKASVEEKASKFGVISLAGGSSDSNAEEKNPSPYYKLSRNQKAALTEALLSIGDFKNSMKLLQKYPFFTSAYEEIGKLFCFYVQKMIDPIYSQCRPNISSSLSQVANPKSTHLKTPSIFFYSNSKSLDCQQFNSINEFADQMVLLMPFIRGLLHNDCILFTKLIRIGVHHLKSNGDNKDVQKFWLRITRHLFLASLPQVTCNPGIDYELWSLLKFFPYETRYGLYGSWKRGYAELPLMSFSKARAVDQTKKVMRRLSKDNLKQFGRVLGKICHSNSIYSIPVILDQLQAYENLIPLAVDAFRFLTEFDMDVMAFVILESLSNPEKSRLKEDGTNISAWLLNLSEFCGTIYHKYGGLDLTSILHYIFCQMYDRNIFDLAVLKGLIQKMSGIESLESVSDAQLDAIVAGEHFRNEFSSVFSQTKSNRKPSQRLLQSLNKLNLTIPMFILIGQLRNTCIYQSDISHLKLLGSFFDQCQETLFQYQEFLSMNLTKDSLPMVPKLSDLCNSFYLRPEVAMYILRLNSISSSMEAGKEFTIESEELQKVFLEKTWKGLSHEFVQTFWKLTLSDIYVPKERYESEIAKLAATIEALNVSIETHSSYSDPSGLSLKKKDREKAVALLAKIEKEYNERNGRVESVKFGLKLKREKWIKKTKKRTIVSAQILQSCIFPRVFFSPMDAVYCAKFIFLLHENGTPGLNCLELFGRIFEYMNSILVGLTEKEAFNLGRFLRQILIKFNVWTNNGYAYNEEALGPTDGFLPGLAKVHFGPTAKLSDMITHKDFRTALRQFLDSFQNALIACLGSKEFMQMRNALIVLTSMNDQYPQTKAAGEQLVSVIKMVLEEEQREDLKLMAKRCHDMLELSRETWIGNPWDYHPYMEKQLGPDYMKDVEAEEATSQKVVEDENVMKVDQAIEWGTDKAATNVETSWGEIRPVEASPPSPRKRQASESFSRRSPERNRRDVRPMDIDSPKRRRINETSNGTSNASRSLFDDREQQRDRDQRDRDQREREQREREQRERDRRPPVPSAGTRNNVNQQSLALPRDKDREHMFYLERVISQRVVDRLKKTDNVSPTQDRINNSMRRSNSPPRSNNNYGSSGRDRSRESERRESERRESERRDSDKRDSERRESERRDSERRESERREFHRRDGMRSNSSSSSINDRRWR